MDIYFSLNEIDTAVAAVLEQNPSKILVFNGVMGAGKTTFIKQLCKQLGVSETTSSPTFSLVNQYITTKNETIFHFDFYRINSENEALDMGVDEYLYSGHWCFIEWSEKIQNLLPEKHAVITIEVQADGKRKIKFIQK